MGEIALTGMHSRMATALLLVTPARVLVNLGLDSFTCL